MKNLSVVFVLLFSLNFSLVAQDMIPPEANQPIENQVNNQQKPEIEDFRTWAMNRKNNISLDHHYTHDGLHKAVAAISAIAEANDTDLSTFADKQARIKMLADELQIDKYSDTHADKAKEAFVLTAELITAIQTHNNFNNGEFIAKVTTAAQKIDPDELLTKQSLHVYNFFDKALAAINTMADQTSWVSN